MDQAVNFRGAAETERQQKLCDLLIKPDLDDFSPMSFGQVASMIARGEQAARAMLPRLRQLADSLDHQFTSRRALSQIRQLYLTELRFEDLKNVSSKLLKAKLRLKVPSRITVAELERAVDRAWGSRFFKRVNYRIEPGPGGTAVVVRVVEQDNDLFNLSVHYDSDLKSSLLLNFTYRNLGFEGSKLTLDGTLSENEAYTASYTIYTNWRPGIALGIKNAYKSFGVNVYGLDGQLEADLDYSYHISQLSLATIFSNTFSTSASLQVRNSSMKMNITTSEDFTVGSYTLTSFLAHANLDTWDRTIYPTAGVNINLRGLFTTDLLKNNDLGWYTDGSHLPPEWFTVYSLSVDGAVPLGKRISLIYSLYGGTSTNNDIPADYMLFLGGNYRFVDNAFPFLGLNFLELSGTHAFALHTGLQYNFGRDKVAQLRANIGKVDTSIDNLFHRSGMLAGAGLTLGWHTPLGPLEYTISYGSRRHEFIYSLNIGYRF